MPKYSDATEVDTGYGTHPYSESKSDLKDLDLKCK